MFFISLRTGAKLAKHALMSSLLFLTAFLGYALCIKFPEKVDEKILAWALFLKKWLIRTETPSADFLQLIMLTRILSALRAGISLDSALDDISRDIGLPKPLKDKIQRILAEQPEKDFLSQFLCSAMQTGISCVNALSSIQKIFRIKIRMRQKITAMASQAKAQAEVLSWLPWVLTFFLFIIDSDWFLAAAKNPISWLLWSFSFALIGLGKMWFQHIIYHALNPANKIEAMLEGTFPDLVIRVLSGITTGKDPHSALEDSLVLIGDPFLSQQFSATAQKPQPILYFIMILEQSSKGAAGLSEELLTLLQDIHTAQETMWEERTQKIPVRLMAPLFACFFPGTFLVLLGLLFPTIGGFL